MTPSPKLLRAAKNRIMRTVAEYPGKETIPVRRAIRTIVANAAAMQTPTTPKIKSSRIGRSENANTLLET